MLTDNRPAEVFPPGEFLKEELEARGWTQTDFAEILGRPLRVVNEIIAGKKGITPRTAKGLADALGTTAEFWLNLEASYQLQQASDQDDSVARRARLYSKVPMKDLIRRNWIESSENIDVLEQRVLQFLETQTLDDEPQFAYAARKSTPYEGITPAQAAWLMRARQLASAVGAGSYSRARLNGLVRRLRTLAENPEDVRHVPRLLADAGVRFLVVEPLPNTKIDGACFLLHGRSPVIALSLRYDRIDCFWHTLMHELSHIGNQHVLGSPSLDTEIVGRSAVNADQKPEHERLADDFAVDALIPQGELDDFITRVRPLYSAMRIQGFASRMKVHPGIVVGQLQYRGEIEYRHHRKLLTPVRHIITQVALTDGWGSVLPAAV